MELSSMLGQDRLDRAYARLRKGIEAPDNDVSSDVRQILGVEHEQYIPTLQKLILIDQCESGHC